MDAITLSDAERRMILTLRNMPDSPLRERVMRLVEDVLAFARNPRCHEMQADGVPCERPEADCDQCQVVTAMLETLERRIPRA
ncbi:MAG TPA: hypothetical protein VK188_10925 [Holophaga sp.]|nr:hypothetical protein [Holophaga sp.]